MIAQLSQLEFAIPRERIPDRNFERGGRSFYFFDFDDNVMRLDTCIDIFSKHTGKKISLSTRGFSQLSDLIGKPGQWQDYEIHLNGPKGSYHRFRDFTPKELHGRKQPFIEDLESALIKGDLLWKGPSWNYFYHAVFNERPIAIITARGHDPSTFRTGIEILQKQGHLPTCPNYLGIFTVSHESIRTELGDPNAICPIPELKQRAIIRSVEIAMEKYGNNPYHRFGMSDDDPENIMRIIQAMTGLKKRYPDNAFFIINTNTEPAVKTEILPNSTQSETLPSIEQLDLFCSNGDKK